MSPTSDDASAPSAASPHIVVVGLPGVGKSSAARRAARRLGRPFVDFDSEIEHRDGMSIERIFETKGEPYFRARELELTRELACKSGLVLAPGGGWVTSTEAMDLLLPRSIMIYLRARPEIALARLRRAKKVRPLLRTNDPLVVIRRLLAEREHAYLRAHHVLDIAAMTPTALINEIVRLAGGPGAH